MRDVRFDRQKVENKLELQYHNHSFTLASDVLCENTNPRIVVVIDGVETNVTIPPEAALDLQEPVEGSLEEKVFQVLQREVPRYFNRA